MCPPRLGCRLPGQQLGCADGAVPDPCLGSLGTGREVGHLTLRRLCLQMPWGATR
jgi:hypothetical protein